MSDSNWNITNDRFPPVTNVILNEGVGLFGTNFRLADGDLDCPLMGGQQFIIRFGRIELGFEVELY